MFFSVWCGCLLCSVGEGHLILQSVLSNHPSSASNSASNSSSDSDSATASGAGLRTVLSLLEHGALPNMTTFRGHTPLSLLAIATTPRFSGDSASDMADPASSSSARERWASAYDSVIVMLLSHGARMSILHPSTHVVSTEPPHHWANTGVQHALEEGATTWSKKEQLDGDVAGLR